MSDLELLMDLSDLAVARCEGVVSDRSRAEIAGIVRQARRRLGFMGEILVVAVAGGTGSGKSSLINAITGENVAQIGVVRPTTDDALAVVPGDSRLDLGRLLSDLGVTEQVSADSLQATVLVDLPDFDSTEESHRHIVEAVLPNVDAVVWVFDPEKYSDSIVHGEFLSALAQYEAQFVFVLNQVDRLGESTSLVTDDLTMLLESDGFVSPEVVPTIADGAETDISDLLASLTDRLDSKMTVISKLATDLRLAANDGWKASMEAAGASIDVETKDKIGLAAATFVSLGVEAMNVLYVTREA